MALLVLLLSIIGGRPESGSPISGLALDSLMDGNDPVKPLPIRPGSAGQMMPGWNVKIVSDDGEGIPEPA